MPDLQYLRRKYGDWLLTLLAALIVLMIFVFAPLQATMFSLLAFYVASAAFRAFRARSIEASLLLAAGVIVLLAQVQMGDDVTPRVVAVKTFLMDYVLKAAERAIVIGMALGVLSTGLRIVLGLERGYLSE